MQIMGRSTDNQVEPFWHLDVQTRPDGNLGLDLVWWQRHTDGPHAGENGYRRYTQSIAEIPIRRWFRLTMRLRQAREFAGQIQVWQDDQLLFDEDQIRTSWSNCAFNTWCTANEWSVNNYSAGLFPTPAVIYVDDVRITTPSVGLQLASGDEFRRGVRADASTKILRRGKPNFPLARPVRCLRVTVALAHSSPDLSD